MPSRLNKLIYIIIHFHQAGFTPLHVACHFGQLNMVRFITARQGANINATTTSGYTPLHQAAQQGHSTIVSHLLDKGADPNILTSVSKLLILNHQYNNFITMWYLFFKND